MNMNLSNYCNTSFCWLFICFSFIPMSKHFALATFGFLLCTDITPQVTLYNARYVSVIREVPFFFKTQSPYKHSLCFRLPLWNSLSCFIKKKSLYTWDFKTLVNNMDFLLYLPWFPSGIFIVLNLFQIFSKNTERSAP